MRILSARVDASESSGGIELLPVVSLDPEVLRLLLDHFARSLGSDLRFEVLVKQPVEGPVADPVRTTQVIWRPLRSYPRLLKEL